VASTANTTVNREDFGLSWNAALETDGLMVGKDVTIPLDIQAIRTSRSIAGRRRATSGSGRPTAHTLWAEVAQRILTLQRDDERMKGPCDG
jgi:hypothetical protein